QVESDGACWRVRHSGGSDEADLLVIALDVGSLQRVVAASSALTPLQARTLALKPTWPFAVWRLWLDRRVAPSRPVFAGITGIGLLDSIAVYDHLQDESIAWARAQGGSVVEMHAYAVPPQHDQAYIRADMLAGLHRMYPETRQAKIVDQCFLLRNDCPAYPPGQSHLRPQVATKWPTLALAGDFVAVPVPSALMERAATSGFLAANTLLAPLGVAPEPIRSVPRLGLFAPRPKPAQGGERTVRRDRGLHLRRSAELWLAGRPAAPAETIDARPDWQQAAPAWIATALAHSQALPGGGWYVLDATRAIGDRPRRLWVCGQRLVVWRAGGAVHAAPDRCPHMGAELSRGCVRDGRLICPWHGLALGPDGHGTWRPLPSYDDGLFIWVRLDGDEAPTATPVLVPRPAGAIAATVRFEVACDPCDVIANRLDPWHGAHLHPQSFAALRLVERKESEITVRAAFRLLGRLAIECDARFYCADPRHIVMTLVQGEGVGSMMETHVTPIAPGRSVINEAVLATSDRTGFRIARQLAARWIGRSLQAAAMRLWREDAPYAERLYALRQVSHM
ncbi:MAG TPA: DUF5914 domain-containing protein, partial [Terriglobales bacterium]|nr:DUF5914 domain-containing protein [Terriglobales bacterium]